MKYFLDTEFHEGFHKPLFGRRRHFIDLISIGIFAEDGREYYAISNDFDIDRAWNSFDIKDNEFDFRNKIRLGVSTTKEYWLRDNVLWPLVYDAVTRYSHGDRRNHVLDSIERVGRLSTLKYVVKKYGKPNKQIAQEIKAFVNHGVGKPEFYGYYADYDWVVFCSLFGRMIDLPEGFPMYCRDLKQMLDDRVAEFAIDLPRDMVLKMIKARPDYPKNFHEHNALDDAKWNYYLYEFIQNLVML